MEIKVTQLKKSNNMSLLEVIIIQPCLEIAHFLKETRI